tara:strand:+ start:2215 stop:2388 length:174 start_codon:yes stop_codon:yes gene_type:complete
MTTVGKFSNGNKKAQITRVEKNGKVRFLAMTDGKLLINKAFVRMYSAKNIVSQYLHS